MVAPVPRDPEADALYALLRDGLARGEGAALLHVALALHEREAGSERASVALAICHVRRGALDSADEVLRRCCAARGETATLVLNRAKVAAERGDEAAADTSLAAALRLDPNHEAALLWWAARQRVRLDDAAWRTLLDKHAAVPGSWRVQLVLYGHALERGVLDDAQRHLSRALAAGKSAVCAAEIAVALERGGAWDDLIRLFTPYRPASHGIAVGERLVRALVTQGRPAEALAVLDTLRAHPAARNTRGLRDAEAHWQRSTARVDAEPARAVVGLAVAAPLAALVLGQPAVRAQVAIAAFTDETRAPAAARPGPALLDERSVLCRALPLALAEAFSAAGVGTYTLLPAIVDVGLVSPRHPQDLDALLALLPAAHLPAFVVTGRFVDSGTATLVEVAVLDLRQRRTLGTVTAAPDAAPAEILAAICDQLGPVCLPAGIPRPTPVDVAPVALGLALPALAKHAGASLGDDGLTDAGIRAVGLLADGALPARTLALAVLLALGADPAARAPLAATAHALVAARDLSALLPRVLAVFGPAPK